MPWESTCRIQRVFQRDSSDCGVACLAMVANISYLAARGVFDAIGIPNIRPHLPYATNFKQLRQALTEFGIESSLERWRGWGHFSGIGILAVNAAQAHHQETGIGWSQKRTPYLRLWCMTLHPALRS